MVLLVTMVLWLVVSDNVPYAAEISSFVHVMIANHDLDDRKHKLFMRGYRHEAYHERPQYKHTHTHIHV